MKEKINMGIETILELLSKNPEVALGMIKGYIEQYKPLVYGAGKELLEIYKDLVNNKELSELQARSRRNSYDAYVEVGFTEDQALALMLNDNLQLMDNMKNIQQSSKKITNK